MCYILLSGSPLCSQFVCLKKKFSENAATFVIESFVIPGGYITLCRVILPLCAGRLDTLGFTCLHWCRFLKETAYHLIVYQLYSQYIH